MDLTVTPLVEMMMVAKSFVKANKELSFSYDESTFIASLQAENFLLTRTAFGLVNGSSFTVNARKLLEIANTLETDIIKLTVEDAWLTLSVKRSKYKIQQLELPLKMDFPKPCHSEFSLSRSDTNLLEGMSKSANQHDFREAMQSVIIESREGYLSFVTTNGHVLVVGEKENNDDHFSSPLILPKAMVGGLKKLASYSDRINIKLGEDHLTVVGQDISIHVPRILTATPNWRPFLSLTYDCIGELPFNLNDSVKLAMTVIDKGDTKNKLTTPLRLTSDNLTLKLELDTSINHFDKLLDAVVDESKSTVSVVELESPRLKDFTLVMNPIYLKDALTHLISHGGGKSKVTMHLNAKEQLFRMQSENNLNYFIKVALKR
ncbi:MULTISPECIES: hypothetical protein [Vibrio]|uniref:hypothetical protein n=1 Tax=Vibrio TaxID=662 RepID=UPI00078DCC85|nr:MULTISPECIES: hypothetical protein [Vibrio]BAU70832.1 hypothetical protein [Vibrio sp. 04Ya108]BBM67599.1 hypothetical protein VA249_42450 [Vibrio alfacsensis]BCN27082.1 hypothetical protein VYA_42740 [Vibrio alfacsensis]